MSVTAYLWGGRNYFTKYIFLSPPFILFKCASIFLITTESSIQAITFTFLPQISHSSISILNTHFTLPNAIFPMSPLCEFSRFEHFPAKVSFVVLDDFNQKYSESPVWVGGLNRYRGKGSHQLDYQYPACFL